MTGLRVGTTGLFGSSLLITVSAGVLLLSGGLCAQPSPSPPTVADVQIVSAEVQRFAKPVLLGPPAAAYDQALVLRLRADRKQVDAFPPSMQPVVYIGREEFRIFQEERNDERGELFLTVHVPGWEKLPEGAPLILTILHGDAARNLDRFIRPNTPRFSRKIIVDKR